MRIGNLVRENSTGRKGRVTQVLPAPHEDFLMVHWNGDDEGTSYLKSDDELTLVSRFRMDLDRELELIADGRE